MATSVTVTSQQPTRFVTKQTPTTNLNHQTPVTSPRRSITEQQPVARTSNNTHQRQQFQQQPNNSKKRGSKATIEAPTTKTSVENKSINENEPTTDKCDVSPDATGMQFVYPADDVPDMAFVRCPRVAREILGRASQPYENHVDEYKSTRKFSDFYSTQRAAMSRSAIDTRPR